MIVNEHFHCLGELCVSLADAGFLHGVFELLGGHHAILKNHRNILNLFSFPLLLHLKIKRVFWKVNENIYFYLTLLKSAIWAISSQSDSMTWRFSWWRLALKTPLPSSTVIFKAMHSKSFCSKIPLLSVSVQWASFEWERLTCKLGIILKSFKYRVRNAFIRHLSK